MFKILFIFFLITSLLTFFLLIGVKNKKQSIQVFTIPFFMKSTLNLINKEQEENDKSFIEKINDFFDDNDNSDMTDDGNGDIDDGGDE
jgi:c-di-AMP phosphodiesterase-like protein